MSVRVGYDTMRPEAQFTAHLSLTTHNLLTIRAV